MTEERKLSRGRWTLKADVTTIESPDGDLKQMWVKGPRFEAHIALTEYGSTITIYEAEEVTVSPVHVKLVRRIGDKRD